MARKTHLYVAASDNHPLLKVGIATNIAGRLATLNTGRKDDPLSIAALYSGTRAECKEVEDYIKNDWSNRIANGEFYDADLEEIMEKIESYEILAEEENSGLETHDVSDNDELNELIADYKALQTEAKAIRRAMSDIKDSVEDIVEGEIGKYKCRGATISLSQPADSPSGVIDDDFFERNRGRSYYGKIRFEPRNYNIRVTIR